MPATVDPEKTKASFKNGILEVTLPKKAPKVRGRKIEVE